MKNEEQDWLEHAWAVREEELYPKLFGNVGPGIYTLDQELFSRVFNQPDIDPRWLFYGVFECPPTPERSSWLYVTSGLTNPWHSDGPDPSAVSGIGCELILEAPQRGGWALERLRRLLAFQILLYAGRYSQKPVMTPFDRVPLRAPIDGKESVLTSALISTSPLFGENYQLPTGTFQFFQVIGMTEDEATFAREQGGALLLERLMAVGAAPVTDPLRKSILR